MRCEADAGVILKAIRKQFSSKLLNKILLLKRSIDSVLFPVQKKNSITIHLLYIYNMS